MLFLRDFVSFYVLITCDIPCSPFILPFVCVCACVCVCVCVRACVRACMRVCVYSTEQKRRHPLELHFTRAIVIILVELLIATFLNGQVTMETVEPTNSLAIFKKASQHVKISYFTLFTIFKLSGCLFTALITAVSAENLHCFVLIKTAFIPNPMCVVIMGPAASIKPM